MQDIITSWLTAQGVHESYLTLSSVIIACLIILVFCSISFYIAKNYVLVFIHTVVRIIILSRRIYCESAPIRMLILVRLPYRRLRIHLPLLVPDGDCALRVGAAPPRRWREGAACRPLYIKV